MGNIVSDSNTDYKLYNDKVLSTFIRDWAINDFDAGLNYGKDYQIKNLLKKRACCTQTKVMTVAFPFIEDNSLNIKNHYFPVSINVFDDKDNLENNCAFINQASQINTTVTYYQDPIDIDNISSASINCSALYEKGSGKLNLCENIKKERESQHPGDLSKISYGHYSIEPDNLNKFNNYLDCTCENSIIKLLPEIEVYSNYSNIGNLNDQISQSNDKYCSVCARSGKCYVPTYLGINTLCLNLTRISDNDKAHINNSQECSFKNIKNNDTIINNPAALPGSTPQKPIIPPPEDKTTKTFIIGLVVIIAIIGAVLVLLKILHKI